MNSFEKEQILEEIKNIYDLKIRELQLQIDSLTNFTDCLLEYTLTNSDDPNKAKQEIKNLYSSHKGKDNVKNYFEQRLK
ncbi:hypothetical protein MXL47_07765 [Enterobacter asburiae]|uniref:hypothetical protein n=1 Tax=Enterobacter asburiae TaxID=61645 RepID=UPI002DB686C0|nr:hypothetical protein [Enterobacter asburiae]MEB5764080.1 hypothetical protein [Enterobacter asburiae]